MRNGDRRPAFGRKEGGFTLIELLLVLAVLGLLAGLAVSASFGRVRQSKEAALKQDLRLMRKGIDDFYADKGKYPSQLGELVEGRYLRSIPKDPFTERDDTWRTVGSDGPDRTGGIQDVKSGSEERSEEGERYSDW